MSRDFFTNFIKQETVDRVTKAIKKWEEEELSEENIEKFVFEDLNQQKRKIIDAQMGIDRRWGKPEFRDGGPVSNAIKNAVDVAAKNWVDANIDEYKVRIVKSLEASIERIINERVTRDLRMSIDGIVQHEAGKITRTVVDKILSDINSVDLRLD